MEIDFNVNVINICVKSEEIKKKIDKMVSLMSDKMTEMTC
jgi:hypothetical protein